MGLKIITVKSKKELDVFYGLFAKFLRVSFPHYSENTIKYFIQKAYTKGVFWKELKRGEREIFLAKLEDEYAGFLTAISPYGGVGFCNWVVVAPELRGKGIASSLLAYWEKQAVKEGAHKVQLVSDKRNVDFYKRRGYKLFGTIKDDYFGMDDYYFYKTLKKSSEKNFLK